MNKSTTRQRFGFVVLCPEYNPARLKITTDSIRQNYPNNPAIAVVGDNVSCEEESLLRDMCDVERGSDHIASLINTGIKKSPALWNVLVFSGSWVRNNVHRYFEHFVRDEKDILFPVVDGCTNFVDASLNGIVIHKKSLESAGDFPAGPMRKSGYDEMELLKTFWANSAIDGGCTFKSIIGVRIV